MQFPRSADLDPLDAAPQPPRTPTRRSARSSPSLPNIYFPMRYAPRFFESDEDIIAFTAQRPHLGPLDLASPLLRAMPRAVRKSLDSAPITPPLTPESAATSDASSVKSHLDLYKFPQHVQHPRDAPPSPSHASDGLPPDFPSLQSQWSHRPAVIRSQSISFLSKAASRHESDPSSLQLLLASPDPVDNDPNAASSGRFLLVSGVPPKAPSQLLKQAFSACGDIRGIFVRYQAEHGVVILAFFNTRQCLDSLRIMSNQKFFDNVTLSARAFNANELRRVLPRSEFIAEGEAELSISTQGHVDPMTLQHMLASFGDLQSFSVMESNEQGLSEFRVEYFDCRAAFTAFSQLNNRTILDTRMRVAFVDDQAHVIAMGKVQSGAQAMAPGSSPSRQHADSGLRRGSGSSQSGNSPHARHSQSRTNSGNSLHHATSEQNLNARLRSNGYQNGLNGSRRTQAPVVSQGLKRQVSMLDMYRTDAVTGRVGRQAADDRPDLSIPEASPSAVDGTDRALTANVAHKPSVPPSSDDRRGRVPHYYEASDAQTPFVVPAATFAPALYPSMPPISPESASSFAQSIPQYEFDPAVPVRKLSWDEELSYLHQVPSPMHYGVMPPHAVQMDQMLRHQAAMFAPTPNATQPHAGVISPMTIAPHAAHPPRLPMIDTSIENFYSASSTAACTPTSITPITSMTDGTPPLTPSIFTPTDYGAGASNAASNERNILDIGKVERGEDTRTTVMIKNIPNKMTDKNLIDFINEVCFRRIDFLYLRMDFMNNCNVGYAFVNFMSVHDLLAFARAKLGVKWNMCSSQKVLQMTYANYQGKEALVEKFKNSCIMDERESWRPKIFYSSGPKQGLPEPFPAPTHMKRKERSQASARERVLFAHQPRHQRAQLSPSRRSPVYGHA